MFTEFDAYIAHDLITGVSIVLSMGFLMVLANAAEWVGRRARERGVRLAAAGVALVVGLLAVGASAVHAEGARPDVVASIEPRTSPAARPELVVIEALTLGADFTIFMREDCPEPLRLKALRHLWKLLPAAEVAPNSPI